LDNFDLTHYVGPVINNAVRAGVKYVETNNIKSFVLGVSGGVDSAVVAAIARMVCDKTNIKLFGEFLIMDGNTPNEALRAKAVCKEYCHEYDSVGLGNSFYNTMKDIDYDLYETYMSGKATHEEKVRAGNIKARLRMIYLYDVANKNNGLVLSTDNLSEYFLGFWTLHGDVGDLGLVQNLWKSEIYMIGASIGGACTLCVDAMPTDGLGITNSDFDQLLPKWTPEMGDHIEAYRFIDDTLIRMFKGQSMGGDVVTRYKETMFKRMNPANINRSELLG